MNGLLKVICLIAVISLCPGYFPASSAQAAMPTVTYLESFGTGAQMAGPGAMDLDDNGNLYVADSDAGVLKFNKFGTQVGQFTDVQVSGGGLAVSADGSRIYVSGDTDADYRRDQVAIISGADGAILGYLGQGAGEFGNAGEIDLDSTGMIYVLDSTNKTIRSYIDDGVDNAIAGSSFSVDSAGRLCALSAMAINTTTDEIFVADKKAPAEVRVYSTQGGLLATYAAASNFGTQLSSLRGIAFDSANRGYFIDNVNAKVAVLDFTNASGSTLAVPMGIVTLGTVASGAQMPLDVVVDSYNRLFVAGSFNGGPSAAVLGVGDFTNPTNAIPPVPVINSPMGGVVATYQVALDFGAVVDSDPGDVVSYEVSATCGSTSLAPTIITATSYDLQLAAGDENGTCAWQVRSYDGLDFSAPASTSFAVNVVEEAPSAPSLVAPVANATDVAGVTTLSWAGSTDPDPNETVSYRVEFVEVGGASLTSEVVLSGASLDQLVAYGEMIPGRDYAWQVVARDSTGLETPSATQAFTFAETGLVIESNISGADVYLGGNPGYYGTKVGQTPYVDLGMPEGDYQVAVVNKGFEPVFGVVTVSASSTAQFVADLAPALSPHKHYLKYAGLKALRPTGNYKDVLWANCIPQTFLADIDNDGNLDLLASKGGALNLFLFSGMQVDADMNLRFQEGELVASLAERKITPFVVDWDNDGRQDLLYGASDGLVRLIRNTGLPSAPVFDPANVEIINADNVPVDGGKNAVPTVADWNGDGAKDLIVGGSAGEVILYLNQNTDAQPVLSFADVLLQVSPANPISPVVVDWDADGDLDVLVGRFGKVQFYENLAGVLTLAGPVKVFAENGKDLAALDGIVSMFAIDADGLKGKDLILTDASGQVRFARSRGIDFVPTFYDVLVQKLNQIADMVTNDSGDQVLLAMISDAVASANPDGLDALPAMVADIKVAATLPVDAVVICDELLSVLP